MDASHREAKLVTSSHQVPVDPNTGDRVAQYERQDHLGALTAAAATTEALEEAEKEMQPNALEEAEKEMQPNAVRPARASTDFNASVMSEHTRLNLEDTVDSSDMHHSNAEYFKKLEELKAAHVETMAKLEKMYQKKLNLKGIQPVVIRENGPSVSSRSVSEKDSYSPITVMPSFLEPDLDLSSSVYASSSEDESPSRKKEVPRKSKVMTYADELISNMWKDFSVEEYIQSDDTDIPRGEKMRKRAKGWEPKVTVPEPFQMMIREQKKRENLRCKSDAEMMHRLLRKQAEEEAECQKKFRANPVPSYVYLPLYHDRVQQREKQRRALRDKIRDAHLASQKPFTFIAREEQKQAAQEKLRDFFKPRKKPSQFKARPLPQSIYGPTARDKVKDELIRNLQAQLRAQECTQDPSLLLLGPAYRSLAARKPKCREKYRCKCKVKGLTSEAENLSERCQQYLLENSHSKPRTAREPLDRAPSHTPPKRDKVLNNTQAEEDDLKETHRPFPSHKSPLRSSSSKPGPLGYNFSKPTVTSRGREQAVRRSLEEKKMLEEERNRILVKQKQKMKELQKLLITRAKAYDSHESLAQRSKSRMKSLRRSEKERMKEYQQELEECGEKLKKRPLLFEKVAQKNARMAAEKHYSNTLKALGICDEFVSKKGQGGKILEYFSHPQRKSFTEDKESLHEEKRDERETGDENDSVDTNNHESCKENDAPGGEVNSVEE